MTIVREQIKDKVFAALNPVVITLDSVPKNNSFLIMVGAIDNGGTFASITQTGAAWIEAIEGIAGTHTTASIFYAQNVSGASTSITVNLSGSTTGVIFIAEYSGIQLNGVALDQSTVKINTIIDLTADTTASNSTSQEDELWIAGFSTFSGLSTWGSPSTFTKVDEKSGGEGLEQRLAYLERIVSLRGVAYEALGLTVSGTPPADEHSWVAALATFKGAVIPQAEIAGVPPDSRLQEKTDHIEEALDNLVEQFKK